MSLRSDCGVSSAHESTNVTGAAWLQKEANMIDRYYLNQGCKIRGLHLAHLPEDPSQCQLVDDLLDSTPQIAHCVC